MVNREVIGIVTKIDHPEAVPERAKAYVYKGTEAEDKELTKIFEATYGKIKPRKVAEQKENKAPEKSSKPKSFMAARFIQSS